ncbi:polyribonucleotide nucleotidyltransferase [Nitrolancea hollandica]|uniref:Polyribonucleotide nucleotidyltransferase n=1 Tax=Nitrolancea hollandica Lb TaxID=1129897 RepID=I4ED76_9BACT|nr:polyribonucleotide nucleotidyltransferase [Nitrolancea hollandica]CCF82638.1 Polyribonucleotide nucleotidyltransferase (Polynucleotide phosphorylase) (PNPase) [Nitrolancea hollandica Lb]
MPPSIHTKSVEVGGRTLTFEAGRIAGLASGAVTVRYGDTLVLSTAVGAKEPREGLDFFPLTVDYEEKMYAAGKIPGGFIKREGRPNESAILAARLTDRPVRPLFPKGYRADVQIISTVLSTDQENEPDILSINGASAALTLSDIPWSGPVGAVRIGDIDGELVVNPTFHQLIDSKLDVVVAGTANAVMMVEGEASGIPEERLLAAVELAHSEIKRLVQAQVELREAAGKAKREFIAPEENSELKERIATFIGDRLEAALFNADKEQRIEATAALKAEVVEHFTTVADTEAGEMIPSAKEVAGLFDSLVKTMVRKSILERGERPDGRQPQEIREIWTQVGYLPRTHGSAIFTRGQTQVVTVTTLGTISEGQHLDGIGIEESKRYLHHYNFPPFSVGEARPLRGPSRRDIGHGALAERSLRAVLPDEDAFPYTLRLVSEVMSSNGSSSMASVCGSTMSLMDAGVPISAPVAGVAMGLVTDPETGRHTVLTDIQGIEDALGDMDFKVAGTETGITGIQMDIKVQGITSEIMREALEQARQGRLFILGKMTETISQPRAEMSPFAPRVIRLQINPQQIGAVIGPGGKVIRGIQESTGAKIDIEDDGSVFISAVDEESARRAVTAVENLTRIPQVGDIFMGRVKTIIPSGAFVEILPGKDGFVHISELEPRRVESVEDSVQIGQEVNVVVTAIRPDGKINLSRKALLTGEMPEPGAAPAGGGRSGGGGRPHGGDRRNHDRGPRGGGEHRGGPEPREPFRGPRPERSNADGEHLVRRPRDSRMPPRRDSD